MPRKVVKVITAPVYGPAGELVTPPGTQVPYEQDLPAGVRYRLDEIDVPDEPVAAEPPPAAPEPPPAAPAAKSVTVKAEAAAGKGTAHK